MYESYNKIAVFDLDGTIVETDDAVNAVKAGKMSATVAQKPELIGKTAVDAAKKIIDGQPVDKALPVPLDLVKQ